MTETDEIDRQRGIRKTVIILLLFIGLVVGLVVHKILAPRVLTTTELRAFNAVVFDKPRRFSDFELTNHEGDLYTKAQLKGHWSLVYFGFTHCPDMCPMTLLNLSNLLPTLPEEIAKNTQVILVTLDPVRDTPEVLAPYVTAFDKNFIGVTGDFLTIRRLANELNVAFAKVTQGDDYTVDHSGNLVLINPRGDYQGFFKPPFDNGNLKITFPSIYHSFEFGN